ncbi:hypothetical protein [Bradyrhizobium sp. Leo121]|uniref:hypothetical protein n=1 Tax=Bradyrhizobium sp. Leo121 TaxID=1571195 RepID=UPI001A929F25|nr:hypothetical protein [Bradyrhizobium sp. Leo121]
MGKDKSILDKITDTVKGVASTAGGALKPDEEATKADERTATYVPLAADGLVSDPMVPPMATAPPRKRRAAPKPAPASARRTAAAAKKAARKRSASKAGKKSAKKRSAKAAKKTAKKTKAAKKTRKARR